MGQATTTRMVTMTIQFDPDTRQVQVQFPMDRILVDHMLCEAIRLVNQRFARTPEEPSRIVGASKLPPLRRV